eukprot:GGOE01015362.1.p1 GENE.GGOE01015362.1~~GGOE01015362.1.p1  ORF type:complete len:690 (-),score=158.72 GGOE01015362.1:181-1956(-)
MVDSLGHIYVADSGNQAIRRISNDGQVTTLVSGSNLHPQSLAMTAQGDILFTQLMCPQIWKLDCSGVSLFAGHPDGGFADGPALQARFGKPTSLVVDQKGCVIVADALNNCIRRISPNGSVVTIAGNATAGLRDGVGTEAEFDSPQAVITDHMGNIMVADTGNNAIRYIDVTGRVTTFAQLRRGPPSSSAFTCCHSPTSILLTHEGSLLMTSNNDHRIYILQRTSVSPTMSTSVRTVPPPSRPRPAETGGFDRGGRKPSFRGGRCGKGAPWRGRVQPYGLPGRSGRADPQKPMQPQPPPAGFIPVIIPPDALHVPLPFSPSSAGSPPTRPAAAAMEGSPDVLSDSSSDNSVQLPNADHCSVLPPQKETPKPPTPFSFAPDASLVVPNLLPPFKNDDRLRIDLEAACGSTLFADVVFLVEGKHIPAHRVVLAARSPHFRELFLNHQDRPLPCVISVEHASPTAISLLLRYIYTGELDLDWPSEDDFMGLMLLSHTYQMVDVYNRLLIRCRRLLTSLSVPKWEAFAQRQPLPGLRTLTLQCIVREFPDLRTRHDPILEATKADPERMFQLMRLALEQLTPAPAVDGVTATEVE